MNKLGFFLSIEPKYKEQWGKRLSVSFILKKQIPLVSWSYFLIGNALEWKLQEVPCTGGLYHFMVELSQNTGLRNEEIFCMIDWKFQSWAVSVRGQKFTTCYSPPYLWSSICYNIELTSCVAPKRVVLHELEKKKKTCRSVGKAVRRESSRTVQSSFRTWKGGRTQKSEKDLIKKWSLKFCTHTHSCKPPQMLEEGKAVLNLIEI